MPILEYCYPFFYFGSFGIKLSLIILCICLIALALYFVPKKGSQGLSCSFERASCNKGHRNKIVLCALAYALLFPVYFFNCLSGSNTSLLLTVAQSFLPYESLISIVLFAALLYGVVINKNKDRYFMAIKNIVAATIFFAVFSTLIVGQIDLFSNGNLFCYLVLGTIFVALISVEISVISSPAEDVNLFKPKSKFEELFSVRQIQSEELVSVIQNNKNGSISICITGDWGAGKTSFINGSLDKLQKSSGKMYEYIYINALEIDDIQSLFAYFFSCIKSCLKKRGTYVGIASEYQSFISAAVGVITHESIGALISKKIGSQSNDYRLQKNNLEQLLAKALGEDKIIVVVDDIERCDKDKARQFVFFIKEIATMKNCISIFATDYEHLVESELNTKKKEKVFFEKFFNYRINLTTVPYDKAMPAFEKCGFIKQNLSSTNYLKPSAVVKLFIERYEKAIGTEESKQIRNLGEKDQEEKIKQDRISVLQNYRQCFLTHLEHPRSLAKLYSTYTGYVDRICTSFSDDLISTNLEKIVFYLNKIKFSESIFLLSFIEACIPSEFEEMKEHGIWVYLSDLNIKAKEKNDKQLIISLAQEYWFGEPLFSLTSNYIQNDTVKFIHAILSNSGELVNLINSFTKEEEEWFAAIEKHTLDKIDTDWCEIVTAILRMFSYDNAEQGIEYIDQIFSFVKTKIAECKYNKNEPFRLFEHDWRNGHSLSLNIYAMEMFYNSFCTNDADKTYSKECAKNIMQFSQEYVYYRLDAIVKLLHYLVVTETDSMTIKNAKESTLAFTKQAIEMVNSFITGIAPLKAAEGADCFEKLYFLVDSVNCIFKKKNFLQYQDIQNDIEHARKTIVDLSYFFKIAAYVDTGLDLAEKFSIREIDPKNVSPQIEYFERRFSDQDCWKNVEVTQQFSEFFNYLKYGEQVDIAPEQLDRLQKLVTIYLENTKHNTMFYRKVLLDISAQESLAE